MMLQSLVYAMSLEAFLWSQNVHGLSPGVNVRMRQDRFLPCQARRASAGRRGALQALVAQYALVLSSCELTHGCRRCLGFGASHTGLR